MAKPIHLIPFEGQFVSMYRIREMFGIDERTMHRWKARGVLNESRIKAHVRWRAEVRRLAKLRRDNGVSGDVYRMRVFRGWDDERAATTKVRVCNGAGSNTRRVL